MFDSPRFYKSLYCGCYHYPDGPYRSPSYLPMVGVQAHTTILNTTTRTKLKQTFTDPSSSQAIDKCNYKFPLYEGVSVVSFKCQIGSRIFHGVVKGKREAKRTFDDAVAHGETAGLLEQSDDAADVFATSIGNIPARGRIEVEICYIGELKRDVEADGIRFTIPTYIAPRYGTETNLFSGKEVVKTKGMKITVDVDMADGSHIKSIQSPSHEISVSIGVLSTNKHADPALTKASATLAHGETGLQKDFVLVVQANGTDTPKAVLETHSEIKNQRAIMTTLVPKFALPSIWPEIVFIVDRSGSMAGNIPMVQDAMKVFLRSLDPGTKFNICSFGSSHKFLFSKSKTLDRSTLAEAEKKVERFQANYGGTETLEAIKATVERRYEDIPLEMIVLTDGDIWQQEEAFKYVTKQVEKSKGQIRLFPLGIGRGASSALVEGLARAGNGFAQSVQEGERLDKRLMRMLKGALSPHINDYTLEIKYGEEDEFELVDTVEESLRLQFDETMSNLDEKSSKKTSTSLFNPNVDPDVDIGKERQSPLPPHSEPALLQAPHKLPGLFAFARTTTYILLSPSSIQRNPTAVVLRGTSSTQGPLELNIPIEVLPESGTTIHALAARKAVQDLEEERGWVHHAKDRDSGELLRTKFPSRWDDIVNAEAVRLGVTFQVANRFCSFVAVEANKKPHREATIATQSTPDGSTDEDMDNDSDEDDEMSIRGSDLSFSSGGSARYASNTPDTSHKYSSMSNLVLQADRRYVKRSAAAYTSQEPRKQRRGRRSTNSNSSNTMLSYGRGGRGGGSGRGRGGTHEVGSALFGSHHTTHNYIRPANAPGGLFGQAPGGSQALVASSTTAASQFPAVSSALVPASGVSELAAIKTEEPGVAATKSSKGDKELDVARNRGSASPGERVRELIGLQDFEGWWPLSEHVKHRIGLWKKANLGPKSSELDQKLWATMLVIVYFHTKMQEEEEIWEMIEQRAYAWIERQAAQKGVDIENLEAKARALFE